MNLKNKLLFVLIHQWGFRRAWLCRGSIKMKPQSHSGKTRPSPALFFVRSNLFNFFLSHSLPTSFPHLITVIHQSLKPSNLPISLFTCSLLLSAPSSSTFAVNQLFSKSNNKPQNSVSPLPTSCSTLINYSSPSVTFYWPCEGVPFSPLLDWLFTD